MLYTLLDDIGKHQDEKYIVSRTNDIVKLGSMLFQDPDNTASDLTDLAKKPECTLFTIMPGIVPKCWRPQN